MIGVNDLSNLGRSPVEIAQTYREILAQIRDNRPRQTSSFKAFYRFIQVCLSALQPIAIFEP